eukprot:8057251-Pyramimonas_sp.AAC.1
MSVSSGDEAIVVNYETVDGKICKRMCNGSLIPSSGVKPGADGFAIAFWKDGSEHLTLTPNSQIIDG